MDFREQLDRLRSTVDGARLSSPSQDPLNPVNPPEDTEAAPASDNPYQPRFPDIRIRFPEGRRERPPSPEQTEPNGYQPLHPRINVSNGRAAVGLFRSLWRASRRWPRIVYIVLGLLMMSSWVTVMYIFIEHEAKYQRKHLEAISIPPEDDPHIGGLFLIGTLRQFDPDTHRLTVEWSMDFLINDTKTPLGGTVEPKQVGIYLNRAAIPETRYDSINDDSVWRQQINDHKNQIYSIDDWNVSPDAVLGKHTWDRFDTEIFFDENGSDIADPWRQPVFGYPWDHWEGSMVFVANDYLKALAQNQSNSYVIPILGLTFASSTLNWRIDVAKSTNTCAHDDIPGCELQVVFRCRRPALVIFSAITAVVINWILTTFIFVMTCEGVVMGRVDVIQGPGLLAVCIAALFALPSVRNILPGAPDFGALIDLIGIIPNVIVVSICTTLVAAATLRSYTNRPRQPTEAVQTIQTAHINPLNQRSEAQHNPTIHLQTISPASHSHPPSLSHSQSQSHTHTHSPSLQQLPLPQHQSRPEFHMQSQPQMLSQSHLRPRPYPQHPAHAPVESLYTYQPPSIPPGPSYAYGRPPGFT